MEGESHLHPTEQSSGPQPGPSPQKNQENFSKRVESKF
jgi:hypothetical protein